MSRFALPSLGLGVLLIWMLQHPYGGIVHDSCLYVLLALERIHPATLATDVFVKFGSQDSYTVFSPLLANAIRLLGLEPAAALGTFLGHVVFFSGAWFLARRLMPATPALLVLGLLAAIPSYYGAVTVFRYVEDFLTPRVIAEGLTLMALAAWLASRRIPAILALLAGMLLHPIMACAGVVLLALLYGVIPRPRLGLALVGGAFAASLLMVTLISSGPLARFDPEWLARINQTSRYLFILQWQQDDWIRAALPAGTLVAGLLTSRTALVRNLCWAALGMAVLGLATTLVFCDFLHVQLFTQVQAWRWLWLEQVLAIVLMPVIARECWHAGPMARATLVVLLAAWTVRNDPLVFLILLLAIACAACARRAVDRPWARPILQGACALLVIAVLFNFTAKLYSHPLTNGSSPAEQASRWLQLWAGDGVLYAALMLGILWLSARKLPPAGAFMLPVSLLGLCAYFAPLTWHAWSTSYYGAAMYDAAAPWRAALPLHAEGLWPEVPLGAWYLLERPSYWSQHQDAGDIFSRRKALETYRRAQFLQVALEAPLPQESQPSGRSPAQPPPALNTLAINARNLPRVCADPQLDFIVSWGKLGLTRLPPITPDPTRPNSRLQLYRCADFRK
jgi:hypothetical protein